MKNRTTRRPCLALPLSDMQNGFVRLQDVRKDVVQACQRFLSALATSIVRFTLDVREKDVFTNLYAVCRNESWHLHGVDAKVSLGHRWSLRALIEFARLYLTL